VHGEGVQEPDVPQLSNLAPILMTPSDDRRRHRIVPVRPHRILGDRAPVRYQQIQEEHQDQ